MNNKGKKALMISAVFAVGLAAGYGVMGLLDGGNKDVKKEALPDTGEKVTILCWNEEESRPMVDLFCRETGTDPEMIEIKNFCVGGYMAPEYYREYLGDPSNEADIIFYEPDWGYEFSDDDSVTLPLKELGYDESDFSDLYSYVVETGRSTVTGELKGVSWQACPGSFCYREDLAKKYLGVSSPSEMKEKLKNWDSFLKTAEELKASGGPALSATLQGVWHAYSTGRTLPWMLGGKFTGDDFILEYAEYAKKLYDNDYVTHDHQWTDTWTELSGTDEVMGYFMPSWGIDMILSDYGNSKNNGKWKCVAGPSDYYWGGTWLAVSDRCDNRGKVKEFIDFFTSDKQAIETYALENDEFMSNKKVMQDIVALGKHKGAEALGGQDQFEVFDKVSSGIYVKDMITPYDAGIYDAVDTLVGDYCDGYYEDPAEMMDYLKDDIYYSMETDSIT